MKCFQTLVLAASTGWLLCVAAASAEPPRTAPASDASVSPLPGSVAGYQGRGVLLSYDSQRRQAVIRHEAIAGYMPAMTMPFDVRDPGELRDIRPGDSLAFELHVSGITAWIDAVRKMDGRDAPGFVPAALQPGRELRAGDPLPDVEFVNERGQRVALRDLRGETLAITFIYMRCPLPTYCPLMNRNFEAAQALLTRLDAGGRWRLLSVSLDPGHDTPEVLAVAAGDYHAQPAHWNFVTAPVETVRLLGNAVGLEFNDANGTISHNLRTIIVDPEGRLRRVVNGNGWTPQELVAEVRAAMAPGRAGN